MRITMNSNVFNDIVKSAKKVIKKDDFRALPTRVHLHLFSTAPGTWYARFLFTDGYRAYEDLTDAVMVPDESGPAIGSFEPPRLQAKGPVEISLENDKTVIRFDEVTFTYDTLKVSPKEDLSDGPNETFKDSIAKFLYGIRTDDLQKPGRTGVRVQPKFLMDAAESMKNCSGIQIDLGGPKDPVALIGLSKNGTQMFRVVLPMYSQASATPETYRKNQLHLIPPGENYPDKAVISEGGPDA